MIRRVMLFVSVMLVLGGCANRDSASDDERRPAVYGGISGGLTR